MELGHWVTGSIGSSFTSGSPGHHCDPVWDPSFSGFRKMPNMQQNVHLKCWNDESHCQVSAVGLKSLDVSPCNELLLLPMIIKNSLAWEYFFTHKSTFGVHYRIGSPGQLGLRVAVFPGHWVTKCDPVPSLIRIPPILHCVAEKNDTDWACYNSDVHQPILIVFGKQTPPMSLFETLYFLKLVSFEHILS